MQEIYNVCFREADFDCQIGLVIVAVFDAIPEAKRAKELKNLDLNKHDLPDERTFGIRWCLQTDASGFKTDLKPNPATQRGILSVVSSVFDPLDLAASFVLPAKRLLQDL